MSIARQWWRPEFELNHFLSHVTDNLSDRRLTQYLSHPRHQHVLATNYQAFRLFCARVRGIVTTPSPKNRIFFGQQKFEGLRNNLEKLFRKSLADLERHKMALEAPTRARVEVS